MRSSPGTSTPQILTGHADKAVEAMGLHGFDRQLPTVYVTGGAQGAQQINGVVGELLDAVRVHVVADDTVPHLCGAYGQGKPCIALTSDNSAGSSYSIAVFEWTVVPGLARRSAVPLVSVVMPGYNSAATLGAAVRSVLTQTHTDVELLVTDDQSSDSSMDLLMELAAQDKRVLPKTAPERGGAGRARNLAIERARGDYVAFLDSDDLWLPEKTEKQLAFAAEGDAPLTFTSYYKMDADYDGESTDWVPNGRVIRARGHVDYPAMLRRDYVAALTAMYDRNALGTRLMPEMRKRQD